MDETSVEEQKNPSTFTRTKLHDLSAFEVDPLENLIGFYSVVGKRRGNIDDGEDSTSQGIAGTNMRAAGVVSNQIESKVMISVAEHEKRHKEDSEKRTPNGTSWKR